MAVADQVDQILCDALVGPPDEAQLPAGGMIGQSETVGISRRSVSDAGGTGHWTFDIRAFLIRDVQGKLKLQPSVAAIGNLQRDKCFIFIR